LLFFPALRSHPLFPEVLCAALSPAHLLRRPAAAALGGGRSAPRRHPHARHVGVVGASAAFNFACWKYHTASRGVHTRAQLGGGLAVGVADQEPPLPSQRQRSVYPMGDLTH
jgi:hypothetical protein